MGCVGQGPRGAPDVGLHLRIAGAGRGMAERAALFPAPLPVAVAVSFTTIPQPASAPGKRKT